MCFYGVALWKNFTKGSLNKIRSCFHKCIKIFFGYPKFHSVTAILLELSLPSFCTLYIIVNTGSISSGSTALTILSSAEFIFCACYFSCLSVSLSLYVYSYDVDVMSEIIKMYVCVCVSKCRSLHWYSNLLRKNEK